MRPATAGAITMHHDATATTNQALDLSAEVVGWKWFEYHAKQRFEMFKFYMTIYAAIVTFAAILYDKSYFKPCFALGALSIFITFVFWRLDVRSRRLIEIGENVMNENCNRAGISEDRNPIAQARKSSDGMRFKSGFGCIFVAAVLVSTSLLILSYSSVIGRPIITLSTLSTPQDSFCMLNV